jgi:hypothetical protein
LKQAEIPIASQEVANKRRRTNEDASRAREDETRAKIASSDAAYLEDVQRVQKRLMTDAVRPRGPQEETHERPADVTSRPVKSKKPASGKRKHRRTDQIDGRSELVVNMKKVFAECFEEKQGEYVSIREVYDVFYKSTPSFEKNVFKHHCRTLFLHQWAHSQILFHKNERCFADMAVKIN